MVLFLLACAVEPGTVTPDPAAGPTWYADVAPLVDEHCVRCHTDAGQASSFGDPATVAALAPTIAAYTAEGLMPPPAPDPECRDYADSERYVLTDEERAVFQAWADAGAPLGDPADTVEPTPPITLAPWDIEVRAGQAYQPEFLDGQNDYRCFLLEVGNDAAVYLTGLEPLVDNPSIVHHVVLFEAEDDELPTEGDPANGFACGGFGEDGWDFVSGWAPGGSPVQLPDGYGIKLRKDAKLVLQMHYFNSFEGASSEVDQSGYGLLTAQEVDQRLYVYPMGAYDFVLPAGDPDVVVPFMVPWSEDWGSLSILGVFPHMHQLATGFDYRVQHPDGTSTCLSTLDGWNFHNQITALFDEPATVEGGDILYVECRYDNSSSNPAQFNDPPEDVVWGEGTEDEMCFGFTYGTLE